MSGDVYGDANDLIVRLRAEGLDTRADAIKSSMYGATSGEILPELRYQLQELQKADDVSDKAKSLAVSIVADINDIIGPPHR